MPERLARKGFLAVIILILIVGGLIGLYFGFNWYNQRYYIALYDGSMTRYIDVPPFAERKTSAEFELIGHCVLGVGTSEQQALSFYKSMCNRLGFMFSEKEGSFTIEVRRNYTVRGEYGAGQIKLSWTPVLPEKLKRQAAKLAKDKSEN